MHIPKTRPFAIVLAAGDGKRLKSDTPKVLHHAAGRPLLAHVLATLQSLDLEGIVVVGSKRLPEIEAAVDASGFGKGVTFAVQDPPIGTADATRVGLDGVPTRSGAVLVVNGDSPLLTVRTLEGLLGTFADGEGSAAMLTTRVRLPSDLGRVVRDGTGVVERIVECRDATDEEKGIDEVNAGVYVFDVARFEGVIGKVDRENAQGEYYLTDVIGLLISQGDKVVALEADPAEVAGVNSRAQLAQVTAELRKRACDRWMDEGVTIDDPSATYIDADVTIGSDATIHPFTFLEGKTEIGRGAEVGPQARIIDSTVAEDAVVSFAVVRSSSIGPEASVGPFASLRPGSRLERGARVGTFVETKETTIGADSKANHLAYLGDATIGSGVNVGAGTITCNWDGREKHETVIDDDAYIGSDTMLVAPVHVGRRAATGAGSVVRGEVPDDALAVGVPARVIKGRGDKMARKLDGEPDDPRQ